MVGIESTDIRQYTGQPSSAENCPAQQISSGLPFEKAYPCEDLTALTATLISPQPF